VSNVSSQDLHPRAGARFVFEREGEALRYQLSIYLPEGRSLAGVLSWGESGVATVDYGSAPGADDAWVVDGALKLARVLKRDPKAKLIRWREG
jgi:hypothetical protein